MSEEYSSDDWRPRSSGVPDAELTDDVIAQAIYDCALDSDFSFSMSEEDIRTVTVEQMRDEETVVVSLIEAVRYKAHTLKTAVSHDPAKAVREALAHVLMSPGGQKFFDREP